MFKIVKEERVNKILEIKDYFEPEGISTIKEYADSVKRAEGNTDYSHIVRISYGNYIKWLMDECDYSEDEARKDANEWLKINDENSYIHHN